jgi:hypothetical protein
MLIWGLLVLIAPAASSSCGEGGHWTEAETTPRVKASRISLAVPKGNQVKEREKQWLESACPVQTVMHSCHAHGDIDRAKSLERRTWVPVDKTTCAPFSADDFMRALQDRRLLFYGDSVMMQLFTAVVCSSSTPFSADVDWYKHGSSSQTYYNDRTCPYGEKHCHLHGASAYFKSYNLTVEFRLFGWYEGLVETGTRFRLLNAYQKGLFSRLIEKHSLDRDDVLVINWGLHAHSKTDYASRLGDFRKDLDALGDQRGPREILFMETWPQHFFGDGSGSGLYHVDQRDEGDGRCFPIKNSSLEEADWKNTYARSALEGQTRVKLIRVAAALRSQHDAHIQASSKLVKMAQADCTHWCFPSGVFSMVLTVLQNELLPH